MNHQDFYAQCAARLGVPHVGTPFPHLRRTRWNNRKAGPGRFPGRGMVRVFATNNIQVVLREPIHVNQTFSSMEQVLSFLHGLGA